MDLNQVNLIGRLTRDPETRTIASGQLLCSFGVACGRKFKGQDGTQKEETLFIDCTAWGKTAEHIGQYLKKGSRLYVGGRLRLESWEDKQSGNKRTKISLVAENVIFLDARPDVEDKNNWTKNDSNMPGNYGRYQKPPAPVVAGMGADHPAWDNSEPDLGEPPF